MKKLLIIVWVALFSILFVDASWGWWWSYSTSCSSSDRNEICSSYINEYNISVCSCNKKALSIPMTIFGDIKWEEVKIWKGAEIFIYDVDWGLLSKSVVGQVWKYWTNDAFKISERININSFEWEAIIKVKYWSYLYTNVKVEKDSWYNCEDKIIFQTNKLCKYNLLIIDSNKQFIWWGGARSSRSSSKNLRQTSRNTVNWKTELFTKQSKAIFLKSKKFQKKYTNINYKLENILKKFNKENNKQAVYLKIKVWEKIKQYLFYIESWNKAQAKKIVSELKGIIKEFVKELKKKIVIKKYYSQNSKINKIEKRIDILLAKKWKIDENEIIELRNLVIKNIEKYLESKKDTKIKQELIMNFKKFIHLLKN